MSPLDTPDAVVSGSATWYGKPLGLAGPGWFQRFVARLLRRKPVSQRFMLRITYRDWSERVEFVTLEPGKFSIREFVSRVMEGESVRIVECAEVLFKGRKSFGADYDPANWLGALKNTPA